MNEQNYNSLKVKSTFINETIVKSTWKAVKAGRNTQQLYISISVLRAKKQKNAKK